MIRPATMRDITYIGANLREDDRRELKASCALDSYTAIAGLSLQVSGEWAWCSWYKDQPIAAFGVAPGSFINPHVWSAWAFGTDRFKRAVPEITRFMLAQQKQIRQAGCRRLEVRSLCGHDIASKWLLAMGANHEGVLRKWGAGGEDFNLWAWT